MPMDRKKYPKDWEAISKRIRFERANNHCEQCGAENYKPHPATGSKVILTVAHLDHNPGNNDESNLKALCQRCHLAHDRKRNIHQRRLNQLKENGYLPATKEVVDWFNEILGSDTQE